MLDLIGIGVPAGPMLQKAHIAGLLDVMAAVDPIARLRQPTPTSSDDLASDHLFLSN
jgi:hypothetical protein